ncbi:MAG: hypothetical protein AAGN82_32040, partial [Myxococcota bacterium]
GGGQNLGACLPRRDLGEACSGQARECRAGSGEVGEEGFCVVESGQQVCCDRPCDAPCESCLVPGLVGTCTALPAGTSCPEGGDPDDPCAAVCDGSAAGTCVFPAGTDTPEPDTCCVAGTPTNSEAACGGNGCDEVGRCLADCADDDDCLDGFACIFADADAGRGACTRLDGPLCDGRATVRVPDGPDLDCAASASIRCDGDACLARCASVDDCVDGAVCRADGTCIAGLDNADVPDCSCRLVGARAPGRDASRRRWPLPAGAALLMLAVATRRREGHHLRGPRGRSSGGDDGP